jgi:Spy/CpxP family protein refolding chaperone
MRSQYKWAIALLSLGLSLAPVLSPTALADDPPKPGAGQGAPGGRRGAGGFVERYHALVNKLDLTDDQKPKIESAFAEAKTAAEGVQKDAAGDRQAAREKMKPIVEALTAKVESVLTDDQKAKLKELAAADRPAGGRRGPASKPAN